MAIATLSVPSSAVAAQCAEMVRAMRLLRNRVDLQSLEQPRRLQEAAMAVLTWADEISSVCRQMQTSLDASTASRAILVPRYPDPGSPSSVLWRPVRQDDRPAILRTAAVLRTAASQLSASIRAADEAIGRHNPQGIATHRAAAERQSRTCAACSAIAMTRA